MGQAGGSSFLKKLREARQPGMSPSRKRDDSGLEARKCGKAYVGGQTQCSSVKNI